MSLFRPRWLDDILRIHPSASPRLRGLKSFEPHHVPALQDPLYADDPTLWIVTGAVGAVVLNASKLGVQTPDDPNIVVTVDGAIIASDVVNNIEVQVIQGGTALLALTTDAAVTKRNRREQSQRSGVIERAGLSRIIDNANAFTGTPIAQARVIANASLVIPIGHRLFGAEQCFVEATIVNTALFATLWGRVTTKGQR